MQRKIKLLSVVIALSLMAAPIPARHAAAGTRPSQLREVHTGFVPSRNGFVFPNRWKVSGGKLMQRIFGGRCGGMAFAAVDYFDAHRHRPRTRAAVDAFTSRRTFDSLRDNTQRFIQWTLLPDADTTSTTGVASRTREELLRLDRALESGPVPIGLVRAYGLRDMGHNHQAVAHSIELRDGMAVIGLYDPNHPREDDVELRVDLRHPGTAVNEYAGGELSVVWRGFFVEKYEPAALPTKR